MFETDLTTRVRVRDPRVSFDAAYPFTLIPGHDTLGPTGVMKCPECGPICSKEEAWKYRMHLIEQHGWS